MRGGNRVTPSQIRHDNEWLPHSPRSRRAKAHGAARGLRQSSRPVSASIIATRRRKPLRMRTTARLPNELETAPRRPYSAGMSKFAGRITIDPEICHGKPCIRGMRYPVESMLEYLAGGDSIEQVLREFPDLEREDL